MTLGQFKDREQKIVMTPFINWVQTSVRLCVSWAQKILGKMRIILKLKDK